MGFQKVEYSFPDEEKDSKKEDIEIESSGAIEIDVSGEKPAKKEEVTQDKDDGVEIEIVDDTPKADRNRKASKPPEDVTDEELEDYSDKVQSRIKHFSKGYHDERRLKEQALRERQELETFAKKLVDENKELKGTVDKNQGALVEQAKKNSALEILSAKRLYKRAYEAGDSDKLLDAQEKLTNAKIKADKLDNFAPSPLQEESNEVQIPTQESASNPDVDPRATEWAQANTWFGDDKEMTGFAMGLHDKLISSGIDPASDEYYENINSRMQKVFPEHFGDEPENKKVKRQSNVVAPATRSTSPKKVTLTQTQVAIAKKLGVPLELYAKKVAEEMRKI
tara:strand:- start:7 stop:1017 length:1011 start_codon:yes stop_codon:yes gene_type:complete